ncbi:MAG: DUF4339 domain-containing protein [Alphaproteobacteria bacterium]|nr:DUF4339 domain-containing protein [Alphaproteobacteria bacterium]
MANWIISVGGRTYGPYSATQMQTFAVEGRLAAHSLVAHPEDGRFVPASQDPDLAFLFRPAPLATLNHRIESEVSKTFGHGEGESGGETAHFLIVADMKSGSITALEEEILRLGPAYPIMPQAWVLSSDLSIGALKNLLIQKLGKLDMLLVVDASHDKLTWSNLGMEAETRIRRIWIKQPQLSAA